MAGTGVHDGRKVSINIIEIKNPDLDAQLAPGWRASLSSLGSNSLSRREDAFGATMQAGGKGAHPAGRPVGRAE
ncbi:MAG: hypothetical protein R3B46_04395 [Phycisphaerales bacterium]